MDMMRVCPEGVHAKISTKRRIGTQLTVTISGRNFCAYQQWTTEYRCTFLTRKLVKLDKYKHGES